MRDRCFGYWSCLPACIQKPDSTQEISGIELANRRIEELRSKYEVVIGDPQYDSSREFLYFPVAVGGSGVIPAKLAVDSRGRVQTIRHARQTSDVAHRRKFGALSRDILELLQRPTTPSSLPVAIWFDTFEDRTRFLSAASATGPGVNLHPSNGVPVLTAVLSHDELFRVSRDGLISVVEPISSMVPFAQYSDDGAADYSLNVDLGFNSKGWNGKNAVVGIDDVVLPGYAIYEDHDAFQFNKIEYFAPPSPCTASTAASDCDNPMHPNYPYGCVHTPSFGDDRCVVTSGGGTFHTTGVASRISSSASGAMMGAAESRLLIGGLDYISPLIGTQQQERVIMFEDKLDMWNWMAEEGAHVVNLSYGSLDVLYSAHYHALDWYVLNRDMRFVSASGNDRSMTDYPYPNIGCIAQNTFCVGSMSASATYGVVGGVHDSLQDDVFSWWSLWVNRYKPGNVRYDIEKPDVVAEGESALVANPTSGTDQWTRVDGTSFAAPVVTSLVAGLADKCVSNGFTWFEPERLRSILVAMAFTPQTYDPPLLQRGSSGGYQISRDRKVGAGVISAESLEYWFCNPPGTRPDPLTAQPSGSGGFTSDGTSLTGTPLPPWAQNGEVSSEVDDTEGDALKSGAQIVQISTVGAPNHNVGRVRAALSTAACPARSLNASMLPDGTPAVDYDLVLVDPANQEVYAVSDSYEDADEQMDVTIPNATSGLELWVLRPAGYTPCQDASGNDVDPVSLQYFYWY